MDLTTILSSIPGQYTVYISVFVAVCAALSTSLPAPTKTTGFYFYLYKAVNFIGLNFGHAKNANTPPSA